MGSPKGRKVDCWTVSSFKSLRRRARINKGSWGVTGEIGKPRVCGVSEQSLSGRSPSDQSPLSDVGDSSKLAN